jgi:hypothetical protein
VVAVSFLRIRTREAAALLIEAELLVLNAARIRLATIPTLLAVLGIMLVAKDIQKVTFVEGVRLAYEERYRVIPFVCMGIIAVTACYQLVYDINGAPRRRQDHGLGIKRSH